MKRFLHWLVHRLGLSHEGRVETWTRRDGRIMVGFRCSHCGKLTGVHPLPRHIA